MTAFALLSGGFLAGCSDDDEPEVKVPESFTVSANSANVMWDDTEAVIDFGANVKWDAVSSAAWVQIDPNKGEAGDHRLFLVMTQLQPPAPHRYGQPEVRRAVTADYRDAERMRRPG